MDEQYIIDLKVKTPGVVPATKKIKALEAEMAKLDKTSESYKQKQIEIGRVQNAAGQSTKKLGSTVNDAKGSIGGLSKGLGNSSVLLGGFAAASAGAATAVVALSKEVIAIEKEFTKLQKTVGRTSGLVGTQLDKATASVSALSKTFGKDTAEINKAASTFSKQTGVSFTEALGLIEKGFLQGADANGNFLDTLEEYPVQLRNAGFAAEDFIKVITQGIDSGIFSDKLLDAIKEADLSLKEQTKSTRDALVNAFGATFTDDILKKIRTGEITTKDALNRIAEQSEKVSLSRQQQAQLTADIFKSAGEDAGGYAKVMDQLTKAQNRNINSLDELGLVQRRQLELQKELALESVRLSDNLDGLSLNLDNIWTNIKTTGLDALNDLIEKLTSAGKLIRQIQDNTNKLIESGDKVAITSAITETQESIALLKEQRKKAEDVGDAVIVTRNAIKAAAEALGVESAFSKQLTTTEIDTIVAEQEAALAKLKKSLSEIGKPPPVIPDPIIPTDKTIKELAKAKKAVIDYTKEFNKLKKSFEDNFESQRLEAQKQFLTGLITEEELQLRLFALNQQEKDVLITITQNKKEQAKTGDEALEIAGLTVDKLKEQSEELDRQLDKRRQLRDDELSIRDSSFDTRVSELRIEEETAVQEVLTSTSITGEEKRQEALDAVRKRFAEKQRQLSIEGIQQQIADAQKAANDLQASIGPTFDGELSIADSEKNAELAEYIAKIQQLKAELGLLNTQQLEANRKLETEPEVTLVERAEQYNGYIQSITQGLQEAVQADIAATDAKLNAQEARIQAGIALAEQGNDELLNQELERQEKLLEERERFANQEKAIAAIQVAANLAVAVAKAAAEGGGIGSIATIATVLGAVGVGLASISGLVAGAFADGVINFQGKGTERSDSNIVAISKGESVITAKGTKNASKMLTMINEGKLSDSDYLTAGLDLEPIQTTNQIIDMRNELNEQIALNKELLEEFRSFDKKISFSSKGMIDYTRTKNKITTKLKTNG